MTNEENFPGGGGGGNTKCEGEKGVPATQKDFLTSYDSATIKKRLTI